MLPLAITGGIAEGKSTVMEILRQQGLHAVSADQIARELWSSSDFIADVSKELGIPNLNKELLREKISADSALRREVNSIFHPRIWAEIFASEPFVVEVPLLIEACLQHHFARVWVVTCGIEEQMRRLSDRVGIELANRLIRTQLPTRAKIPFADEVIRTNLPPPLVLSATHSALAQIIGKDTSD